MATVSKVAPPPEHPNAWQSLWRNVTRFDWEKVAPWIAARNAIGVVAPLVAALVMGNPAAGSVAATGALNVSFSDGTDPYRQRARRMLTATFVGAIAVVVGGLCGHNDNLAIALTAAWAFVAGMLVSLDNAAGDIGLISLVTLVVFSARPMTWEEAVYSGLLALSGGLLQTFLSIALWPVKKHEPEQRAIGDLYVELSRIAAAAVSASEAPPASSVITQAHKMLSGRSRDRSIQGERYRFLLSQAERIRLSLLMISRLRARLEREPGTELHTAILDRCREVAARILMETGTALLAGGSATISPESLRDLNSVAEALRATKYDPVSSSVAALLADARFQVDALGGQLRSAMELAAYSTPLGRAVFERRQAETPWTLRLVGTLVTLRANLTLESAAFRHAIRLAACVALGDTIARYVGLQRSYWAPMTIVIILKPDFTATFSRGVLRLVGTFIGLGLATALFHFFSVGDATAILLIGVFAFLLKCFGPANYGIFVVAVSALVVVLFALTGVAPGEVIADRGLNTALGGVLALAVYSVWPTWERARISETIAQLLDSYRQYFRAVRDVYSSPRETRTQELERVRLQGRLARSNLEASVERFSAEPRVTAEAMSLLNAILASSHRLVHAMMALDAGLTRSSPVPARESFHAFANKVETTLHSLAESLRGSNLRAEDLPDLREYHHALVHSGDALTERYALVNVESDRITNSLNTLAGQILQWQALFSP